MAPCLKQNRKNGPPPLQKQYGTTPQTKKQYMDPPAGTVPPPPSRPAAGNWTPWFRGGAPAPSQPAASGAAAAVARQPLPWKRGFEATPKEIEGLELGEVEMRWALYYGLISFVLGIWAIGFERVFGHGLFRQWALLRSLAPISACNFKPPGSLAKRFGSNRAWMEPDLKGRNHIPRSGFCPSIGA